MVTASPELLASLLIQAERHLKEGHPGQAVALYQRALQVQPLLAPAWNGLGTAFRDLGRMAEAEAAFLRAVAVLPGHGPAWTNLGILLCGTGRAGEGAEACRKALDLEPDDPQVQRNLATALRLAGRFDAARDVLERLVEGNPGFAPGWIDLGVLFRDRRRMEAAVAACDRAIALAPGNVLPYRVKAHALFQGGHWREAEAAYDQALALWPRDAGLRIRRALLLPLIPADRAEMAAARSRLRSRLEELLADPDFRLDDPYRDVGSTDFYLAYQGEDDRPLRETLARLYLKACPSLAWETPHCALGPRREGPLRVGFLSNCLTPGHTIAKLTAELIRRLPRDRFATVLLRPLGQSGLEEVADKIVPFPLDLPRARATVAAEELDVLVYPDLGMDAFTYFLAFARLAPVQCVTWGHPVTTGIPAIDWFLSTPELDPPGAEVAYSERLARLDFFPACPVRPATEGLPGRGELGLPEDRRLYVCTQTLFKLHPDFDPVLAAILARDESAEIVMIEGVHTGIAQLLRRRLEPLLPGGLARVRLLPGLDARHFLGLCAAADVLLDSFPFCGGNTSLEAFAVGTPVVTLPTGLMRGRVTAAFYRRMGLDDLIARNPAHYVDLALGVATNPARRAELSARIREKAGILFENPQAVTALAGFLETACSRQTGR